MTEQMRNNIEEIERQLAVNSINASYSGCSDTNGISIYFILVIGEDVTKLRFSDHGISNPVRMATEKCFNLPIGASFEKVNGKITGKYVEYIKDIDFSKIKNDLITN